MNEKGIEINYHMCKAYFTYVFLKVIDHNCINTNFTFALLSRLRPTDALPDCLQADTSPALVRKQPFNSF